MRLHGVDARFFVDVPQIERGADAGDHLGRHLGAFVTESWPFGDPRPRIYYDKRALVAGPPSCSLHAKCVVVDGARAFVSSANFSNRWGGVRATVTNFTQRGQERNIEVGVLIEDAGFAAALAGQWLGLIEVGLAALYVPRACPSTPAAPPLLRQSAKAWASTSSRHNLSYSR